MKIFSFISSSIIVIILLSFFNSCAQKSRTNQYVFESLIEGISLNNKKQARNNKYLLESIEDKLHDPVYFKKAEIWYPRAKKIKQLTDGTINYIKSLKELIKTESGDRVQDLKTFTYENTRQVKKIFIEKGKAYQLMNSIHTYKSNMLAIDPSFYYEFNDQWHVVQKSFENNKDSVLLFFENTTITEALAFLSQIENNILVIEEQALVFCHDNFKGIVVDFFEEPLIEMSSSFVKPGEMIFIKVGVGGFIESPDMHISINGKRIEISENTIGKHEMVASNEPGKHKVHIAIQFKDMNGMEKEFEMDKSYTVVPK